MGTDGTQLNMETVAGGDTIDNEVISGGSGSGAVKGKVARTKISVGTRNQDQGDVSITNPLPAALGDGNNAVAVKPAMAAVASADPALAVGISPNSPLPAGGNALGTVGVTSQPRGAKHFAAFTATSTAAQLFPARPGRIRAFIQNIGSSPVNIGDSTVTTSTGLVLQGGQTFDDPDSNDAWWVVAAGSVALLTCEVY